jgi:adenosine deaminase CECR1
MLDGQEMAEALDRVISSRVSAQTNGDPQSSSRTVLDTTRASRTRGPHIFTDSNDYFRQRREVVRREKTLAFDYRCRVRASRNECHANDIIQRLRELDRISVYGSAQPRQGFGGQSHPRYPGDHFLVNRPLIEQTNLFKVAQRMPKGGHLHIHFNACLQPNVLLEIAAEMDRMFVTSDIPLTPHHDYLAFDRCEIQFSILTPDKERPGDIFSQDYQSRQTMKFSEFLERFPKVHPQMEAMEWLKTKLVVHEGETYNVCQTSTG